MDLPAPPKPWHHHWRWFFAAFFGAFLAIAIDSLDAIKRIFPGFEAPTWLGSEVRVSIAGLILMGLSLLAAAIGLFRSLRESEWAYYQRIMAEYDYKAFVKCFDGLRSRGKQLLAERPQPGVSIPRPTRGEANADQESWQAAFDGWIVELERAIEHFTRGKDTDHDELKAARSEVNENEKYGTVHIRARRKAAELDATLEWLDGYIERRPREAAIPKRKARQIRKQAESEQSGRAN